MTRISSSRYALAILLLALPAYGPLLAENIDPDDDGSQYAWAENVGWLNAEPANCSGCGVEVSESALTGYLWGENIGWVSLSCGNTGTCATVDYGVHNDGLGVLSGYAWAENVGWISFSCANTASCGAVDYGVTIDPDTGVFAGHAWGENIGWISFASAGPHPFNLTTSWRGAVPCDDADGDGYCTDVDNCPEEPNPGQSNVDGDAYGDLCDLCPGDPADACDPDGSTAEEVPADQGGTVETPDGGMNVDVPPGALNEDTTISVTETVFNDPEANLALSTGTGLGLRLHVYVLEADGAQFNSPVTITIVADVTTLNQNQRDNLNLYLENAAGDLEPIPGASCVVVGGEATCTAQVMHFSVYALVAPLDGDDDGIPDLFGGVQDICPNDPNVITGFLPPMVELVPAGEEVVLPDKAFKSNRTLPMKLDYHCGTVPVTDQDGVTAPELLAVWRVGDAEPLPIVDPDSGESNDSGVWFRYSDEHWVYNFDTRGLPGGTYEVSVRMPDGRVFTGGFVLR